MHKTELLQKSVAPLNITRKWLGHAMNQDFSAPVGKKLIRARIHKVSTNEIVSESEVVVSKYSLDASASGLGIDVAGGLARGERYAVYRAAQVTEIEELDLSHAKISSGTGYVPVRIYRGWALYLVASSSDATFSVDAAAKIFGLGAKVSAQASFWRANVSSRLRGPEPKTPGAIVIPSSLADVETKFKQSGRAEPIFVDYQPVGTVGTQPLYWPPFTPPPEGDFDKKFAAWRWYRDPRVTPGIVRLVLWDYLTDDVVFEMWNADMNQHEPGDTQWRIYGGTYLDHSLPIPPYSVKWVWVGHSDAPLNQRMDAETGWTLEWWRRARKHKRDKRRPSRGHDRRQREPSPSLSA